MIAAPRAADPHALLGCTASVLSCHGGTDDALRDARCSASTSPTSRPRQVARALRRLRTYIDPRDTDAAPPLTPSPDPRRTDPLAITFSPIRTLPVWESADFIRDLFLCSLDSEGSTTWGDCGLISLFLTISGPELVLQPL